MILMEHDFKKVAQPHRRLNPVMKEILKKEVLKLLNVGMIYLISNNAQALYKLSIKREE